MTPFYGNYFCTIDQVIIIIWDKPRLCIVVGDAERVREFTNETKKYKEIIRWLNIKSPKRK
jgi:hypothetical protein